MSVCIIFRGLSALARMLLKGSLTLFVIRPVLHSSIFFYEVTSASFSTFGFCLAISNKYFRNARQSHMPLHCITDFNLICIIIARYINLKKFNLICIEIYIKHLSVISSRN